MSSKHKRLWPAVLGTVLSIAAIYALLGDLDWRSTLDAIRAARVGILALTVPLGVAAMTCQAARTLVLCGEPRSISLISHLFGHYLAFIGNTILPFRVGELFRIDYVAKQGSFAVSRVVGIVGTERTLDMVVILLCLATVGAANVLDTGSSWKLALSAALTLALVIGLAAGALFPARLRGLLRWLLRPLGEGVAARIDGYAGAFLQGLRELSSARSFIRVAALTLLRWSITIATTYLWLAAFGIELPWSAPITILCFLAFGTMLPSSVAFVGTYHFAFVSALTLMGLDEQRSLAVALVAHALTFAPPTLIGATWIAIRTARGQAPWGGNS